MAFKNDFEMQKHWTVELWDASTNEQKVVDMPKKWYEKKMHIWPNGPMNPWINEPIIQWMNQPRKELISEWIKESNSKSMHQWSNDSKWISESLTQCDNKSMIKQSNELMS